jgi:hypothetical protein
MNKVIYTVFINNIGKIIIDDVVNDDIEHAKFLMSQARCGWRSEFNIPVPIEILDSNKSPEWDCFVKINDTCDTDVVHDFYESDRSLIDNKRLKDLGDIYVSDSIYHIFKINPQKMKKYFKAIPKKDADTIKRDFMLRNLEGENSDQE